MLVPERGKDKTIIYYDGALAPRPDIRKRNLARCAQMCHRQIGVSTMTYMLLIENFDLSDCESSDHYMRFEGLL